jgi:hypothetical protein
VLALFGGQYMVNQAIDSRLDSLEATVTGNGDTLKTSIDRVYNKLDAMEKSQGPKVVDAAAVEAPTPDKPQAAEPAEKEEQEAQEGE